MESKPNSICFARFATPGAECRDRPLYSAMASSLRPWAQVHATPSCVCSVVALYSLRMQAPPQPAVACDSPGLLSRRARMWCPPACCGMQASHQNVSPGMPNRGCRTEDMHARNVPKESTRHARKKREKHVHQACKKNEGKACVNVPWSPGRWPSAAWPRRRRGCAATPARPPHQTAR